MYLVTNKTTKGLPEIYPSFLIDGLIQKGKTCNKVTVRKLTNGYEIKTKNLWIEVNPVEFVSSFS